MYSVKGPNCVGHKYRIKAATVTFISGLKRYSAAEPISYITRGAHQNGHRLPRLSSPCMRHRESLQWPQMPFGPSTPIPATGDIPCETMTRRVLTELRWTEGMDIKDQYN